MQFATYNVQSGGFSCYRDYETNQPPRLEAIQEIVTGINADVIGLTDTFRWHELYDSADLRAIFGYEHADAMPINDSSMGRSGQAIGITILSRRELVNPAAVTIGERQALGTSVELDDNTMLSLCVAYFHHASETKRIAQAGALAEYLRTPSGELESTVVMGDLNTVSRSDRKAQLIARALRLVPKSQRKGLIGEATGVLEGSTYTLLRAAEFEDANKNRLATWPTPKLRAISGITMPPLPSLLRPDHILHSPDMTTNSCTVLKNGPFASDHFPLIADIAMKA